MTSSPSLTSLPQAPLPASVIRKILQGNVLSLLSVADKSVFKETYMLAGKTTAPFPCIHEYFIQLSRPPKLYRLYIQNHISVFTGYIPCQHAIPSKAELFGGLNIYTDCPVAHNLKGISISNW